MPVPSTSTSSPVSGTASRPVSNPAEQLRWAALLSGWGSLPGPQYRRLAQHLSGLVTRGQLVGGTRLPAERQLAQWLSLSRSTVVAAYDELSAAGLLTRVRGSGTRVAAGLSRLPEPLTLQSPLPSVNNLPYGEIDLTIAVPVLGAAQRERLQALSTQVLAQADPYVASVYHPLGLPALRECLAQLYTHAGLPTIPEQVIVTSGAQQAIALVAGLTLRRGDCALLETPTYFGAIDVMRACGAHLRGLEVTATGVNPQHLQAALQRHDPRLLFLTPTFQNPTGAVMPLLAREEAAQYLHAPSLTTIEDDSLLDLAFADSPALPPRLACFAPQAQIVSVGSLSKLFWAGLRVGWLRAPRPLVGALSQAKTLQDFGGSVMSQLMALELLRDLSALQAQRASSVQPARDLLAALLSQALPEWRFEVPLGGQFLWVELPTRNATGFTHYAQRYGLRLFPGAAMGVEGLSDSYLRLPFTLPPAQIPSTVERLQAAWQGFVSRQSSERLS